MKDDLLWDGKSPLSEDMIVGKKCSSQRKFKIMYVGDKVVLEDVVSGEEIFCDKSLLQSVIPTKERLFKEDFIKAWRSKSLSNSYDTLDNSAVIEDVLDLVLKLQKSDK